MVYIYENGIKKQLTAQNIGGGLEPNNEEKKDKKDTGKMTICGFSSAFLLLGIILLIILMTRMSKKKNKSIGDKQKNKTLGGCGGIIFVVGIILLIIFLNRASSE
jgi:hypothetical protein